MTCTANAIKNTWTVEEINFQIDITDLHSKMTPADRHLIHRLVAFFATGDSIVSNNLVLNLYQHLNAPEARMYLSRQLYEEALHVQFYLTLLDNYLPDPEERARRSRRWRTSLDPKKADFCFKWIDSIQGLNASRPRASAASSCSTRSASPPASKACSSSPRSPTCTTSVRAACCRAWPQAPTGCSATRAHMEFAFESVRVVREEEPDLFDEEMEQQVYDMLAEAIECEVQFAEDVLSGGVAGISTRDMRQYLQHCADQHFAKLGMEKKYNVRNPLPFMELQDVQELTNFFERRVSAYQVGVQGEVAFDMNF
jgi:ribonucleoside-diphosphate reductase beta chain